MTNDDHDLVRLLEHRAAEQARQLGFTFLADGETTEQTLNFGELERRARAVGALLQAYAPRGARILLLYPPGLDYIVAFFGCLVGGYVAVPAYPPPSARTHRSLQRLESIIIDSGAEIVLTTSAQLNRLGRLDATALGLAKARWLATDTLEVGMESAWRRPEVRPDS